MPIYEYHCNACGSNFELVLRFSDTAKDQVCPNCNDTQIQKKLSAFASIGGTNAGSTSNSGSSCNSRGGFS
ncbi:MAG: zinc ribbon domain-containing protein [Chloroflexota bacterium]